MYQVTLMGIDSWRSLGAFRMHCNPHRIGLRRHLLRALLGTKNECIVCTLLHNTALYAKYRQENGTNTEEYAALGGVAWNK